METYVDLLRDVISVELWVIKPVLAGTFTSDFSKTWHLSLSSGLAPSSPELSFPPCRCGRGRGAGSHDCKHGGSVFLRRYVNAHTHRWEGDETEGTNMDEMLLVTGSKCWL